MTISSAQKKYLKGLAHSLKPCVLIGGSGITPGVLAELESQLKHHELIKVRVRSTDRDERDTVIADLLDKLQASLVNRLGNIATIYRARRQDPRIVLPRR